ncbi:MAG: LysR family glycine cleavage system transcriptional activator [Ascidiaceihabitans sp.]|jgi:LysR family glycine cleavage system transcriptional activator
MRKIPSLTALRAFDAVARHQSIARAGGELLVSASAVSQQVTTLEKWLGTKLLIRSTNSIKFTPDGDKFAVSLGYVFDDLEAAVSQVDGRKHGVGVRLSVLPSLASAWLIKRLPASLEDHFDGGLSIDASAGKVDFERENFDLAFRSGSGDYDGCTALKVFDEYVGPACSSDYFKQNPVQLDQINACVLLSDTTAGDTTSNLNWDVWLQRAGVPQSLAKTSTHRFTDTSLTIQAAKNGSGVMLGRSALIADEIVRGELIYPFQTKQISDWPYYLVYPSTPHGPRKAVQDVIDWILEQGRSSEGVVAQ